MRFSNGIRYISWVVVGEVTQPKRFNLAYFINYTLLSISLRGIMNDRHVSSLEKKKKKKNNTPLLFFPQSSSTIFNQIISFFSCFWNVRTKIKAATTLTLGYRQKKSKQEKSSKMLIRSSIEIIPRSSCR